MTDQQKQKRDISGRLMFDKATVETCTAGYPDELCEGTRWLASFALRRCDGKLQVLAATIQKEGFNTTDSTLSKVLRGQWNRDAEGKAANPIIKQSMFMSIITALQKIDRALDREVGIPFVETSTFEKIKEYIEVRSQPGRICKMGFISGPTGGQKSESFRELARRSKHLNVFHWECPEKANMGETVMSLCKLFGRRTLNNMSTLKSLLAECITADTTLIIDNIQKLYKPRDGTDQRAFNYFQKLQDDTRCTLILSATYEFMHQFHHGLQRGYFEQFIGRCGGHGKVLVLPPFAEEDEVLQFAEAFEMKDPETHLKYLVAVSRLPGRIRALLQYLQDGKDLAEGDEKPFTIDYVQCQLLNEKRQPLTTREVEALCVEPTLKKAA